MKILATAIEEDAAISIRKYMVTPKSGRSAHERVKQMKIKIRISRISQSFINSNINKNERLITVLSKLCAQFLVSNVNLFQILFARLQLLFAGYFVRPAQRATFLQKYLYHIPSFLTRSFLRDLLFNGKQIYLIQILLDYNLKWSQFQVKYNRKQFVRLIKDNLLLNIFDRYMKNPNQSNFH